MARLLCWCLFILQNTAVILDLIGFLINQKLFLSTSEYHNILLYYQGRKWNLPDFWNRHNHSLSKVYRFIFEAATFSFTNLFFPPNHLSLLSSGLSLCCLPHLAPTTSRKKKKKNKQLKKICPLWAQCETLGLIEDYPRKFHPETNGSKLSKRWLAQLSENPVDCACGRSFYT